MSLPRFSSLARAPLAAALAAALLAGCGSSSSPAGNGLAAKSPEQIVTAATAAATAAASVHIAGSIVSENKPISLDMELVAGKGGKGHVSVEGLRVDVVDVEHAFYLNGSPAFYRHIGGAAAAQLLQGKWLKAPAAGGNFSSLAQLTNIGQLLGRTLGSHGKLAPAGTTTINGQPAVGVTEASKGGTLYVASTGTAYPLQISKSGASAGRITFDRWNQPVTLTAPANAININQLQNGH